MGRFQSVQGNTIVTAFDVYDEVLSLALEHLVVSIVRTAAVEVSVWVMLNENISACGEGRTHIHRALSRAGGNSL